MSNEKKDMSGAMFPNKYKKAESHPDARGFIVVEGKEWEIAAWTKTSKAGEKYYGLAVSEPYKKDGASEEKKAVFEPSDDDLPF